MTTLIPTSVPEMRKLLAKTMARNTKLEEVNTYNHLMNEEMRKAMNIYLSIFGHILVTRENIQDARDTFSDIMEILLHGKDIGDPEEGDMSVLERYGIKLSRVSIEEVRAGKYLEE